MWHISVIEEMNEEAYQKTLLKNGVDLEHKEELELPNSKDLFHYMELDVRLNKSDNEGKDFAIAYLRESPHVDPYTIEGYRYEDHYRFYAYESDWDNSIDDVLEKINELVKEHGQTIYFGASVSGQFTQDLDFYIKVTDESTS